MLCYWTHRQLSEVAYWHGDQKTLQGPFENDVDAVSYLNAFVCVEMTNCNWRARHKTLTLTIKSFPSHTENPSHTDSCIDQSNPPIQCRMMFPNVLPIFQKVSQIPHVTSSNISPAVTLWCHSLPFLSAGQSNHHRSNSQQPSLSSVYILHWQTDCIIL